VLVSGGEPFPIAKTLRPPKRTAEAPGMGNKEWGRKNAISKNQTPDRCCNITVGHSNASKEDKSQGTCPKKEANPRIE